MNRLAIPLRRATASIALAMALMSASAASAAEVVFVEPRGLDKGAAQALRASVQKGLGAVPLRTVRAPSDWSETGSGYVTRLFELLQAQSASALVDAAGKARGKKVTVVAVDGSGRVVFEQTATLPKPPAKRKALLSDLGKKASRAIAEALSSGSAPPPAPVAAATTPTTSTPAASSGATGASKPDPFASLASPGWSTASPTSGSTSTPSSAAMTSAKKDDDEPATVSAKDKGGKPRTGKWKVGFWAGGAAMGVKDSIDTSEDVGDRNVSIAATPCLEAGVVVGYGAMQLRAAGARRAAELAPSLDGADESYATTTTRMGGTLAWSFGGKTWEPSAFAGVALESTTVDDQPDVLWTPPSESMFAEVGGRLAWRGSGKSPLLGEIELALIPWGQYQHELDAGAQSKASMLGGALRGMLRYDVVELGKGGALYLAGTARAEFAKLTSTDAPSPATTGTVREVSLPIGDEGGSKLGYGAGLVVGVDFGG